MMLQSGWDVLKKTKCDGGSIMSMMGSTSEKMYLCQVPNFGFEMIKLPIKTVVWMNQYGIMNRVMLVMRSYNGINLTTLGVRVGCL